MLIFLVGCEDDSQTDIPDPQNLLIVEGYIFANEPVDHIRISKVHQSGQSSLIPVTNAEVALSQGGLTTTLSVLDSSRGVYHISDTGTVFSGSDPISLTINYNGISYSSQTSFPPPIHNLSISNPNINVSNASENEVLATLSWDHADGENAYGVFIRKAGSDTLYQPPNYSPSSDSPLYTVHTHSAIDLYPDHFSHFGNYHLYVSAVNPEYMNMLGDDNSPDLRDGPSNIDGAWGVFTAFNGQSVAISVE